jgi:hypothetical protein
MSTILRSQLIGIPISKILKLQPRERRLSPLLNPDLPEKRLTTLQKRRGSQPKPPVKIKTPLRKLNVALAQKHLKIKIL